LPNTQDAAIREEGAAGRAGCSCSLIAGLPAVFAVLWLEGHGPEPQRRGPSLLQLRICSTTSNEMFLSSAGGRILEVWGLYTLSLQHVLFVAVVKTLLSSPFPPSPCGTSAVVQQRMLLKKGYRGCCRVPKAFREVEPTVCPGVHSTGTLCERRVRTGQEEGWCVQFVGGLRYVG